MIKTEWRYSTDTEAQRVLHNAYHIASGFFRVNNFYVLPMDYKTGSAASVVRFPDLKYNQIPRFWEKVKQLDTLSNIPFTLIDTGNNYLLEKVKGLLIKENIPTANYSNVKDIWEKASADVLNEIFKVGQIKKDVLKKIIIFPTVIGTTSSFSWAPDEKKEIYIYLRDDQDIHALTEAILTTLTRRSVYEELEGNWSESELLVDWLTTKSSVAQVLMKYQPETSFVPTIKGTRIKQNASMLKKSEEFYEKMGLPKNKKLFEINDSEPTVHKIPLTNLTLTEKTILKLLIEKANNVASFDDLGNLLFKSEEEFSLYAISKQIERLRNKLEANGISGSYIQTLRGQGYILKN